MSYSAIVDNKLVTVEEYHAQHVIDPIAIKNAHWNIVEAEKERMVREFIREVMGELGDSFTVTIKFKEIEEQHLGRPMKVVQMSATFRPASAWRDNY